MDVAFKESQDMICQMQTKDGMTSPGAERKGYGMPDTWFGYFVFCK